MQIPSLHHLFYIDRPWGSVLIISIPQTGRGPFFTISQQRVALLFVLAFLDRTEQESCHHVMSSCHSFCLEGWGLLQCRALGFRYSSDGPFDLGWKSSCVCALRPSPRLHPFHSVIIKLFVLSLQTSGDFYKTARDAQLPLQFKKIIVKYILLC